MGKYERRKRSGVMFYHEDLQYMKLLPDGDVATIVRFLSEYSCALADGTEIPPTPSVDGFAALTCKNMLAKLIRDHDKYVDICEKRSVRDTQGDLSQPKDAQGNIGALTLTSNRNVSLSSSVSQSSKTMTTIYQLARECGFKLPDMAKTKLAECVRIYGYTRVEDAIRRCKEYGACTLAYLKAVLGDAG